MSTKWGWRGRNRTETPPKELEPKDFFKHVLDTRNFEITNFWLRSNYFLVLDTGLAIGSFNIKDAEYAALYRTLVALLGVFVCTLWTQVALDSKFWQVRRWPDCQQALCNLVDDRARRSVHADLAGWFHLRIRAFHGRLVMSVLGQTRSPDAAADDRHRLSFRH